MCCVSQSFVLAIALVLCACQGTIGDASGEALERGEAGRNGAAAEGGDPSAPFRIARHQPSLLSFDARVRRVAAVLGVPMDHPMLAELHRNRLALGDYDHAQNVIPDELWIASRMNRWVRSMLPVCGSPTMKARYPDLPADLAPLIRAAWGRDATPEDLAEFDAASALDAEARYRTICLAVFTSAEFVYQ